MRLKGSSKNLKLVVVGLCLLVMLAPMTAYGVPNFISAINYEVGGKPKSVAIGDFNKDGYPDIVTANSSSNLVSVLLNDGHGEFQKADYEVGSANIKPDSVAVGDLNGDGNLDIVTANSSAEFPNNVSILLGAGNGTFGDAVNYATDVRDAGYGSTTPVSVAVGDYNADGKIDIAVANYNSETSGYYVVILPGDGIVDGDVVFDESVLVQVGDRPTSVVSGDINGDSYMDLVVTNSDMNNVYILSGDDSMSISTHEYAVAINPVASAIGDIDGDGNADIAVAAKGSGQISILQADGAGSFQDAVHIYAGCGDPRSLAMADLDDDGDLDIVVGCEITAQLSILLNNTEGSAISFQAAGDYALQGFNASVVIADFNDDGHLDVAASNYVPDAINHVSLLLGNGDGTLQVSRNYGIGGATKPESIVVSDFDDDGNLDVATANNSSSDVTILYGNGNGAIGEPARYTVGSQPIGLAVGDFNLDGKSDLAVANNGDNSITVLLNEGTGAFQKKDFVTNTATGTKSRAIAVSDFNQDGRPDIVVANTGSNSLTIMLGDGEGEFIATSFTDALIQSPRALITGDFDQDGIADLAVSNTTTKMVLILLGNGDGTFTTGNEYGGTSIPLSLAAGDFNQDGHLDIAVASANDDRVTILFGEGEGIFRGENIAYLDEDPLSLAVGDFNGDGKADIGVAVSFLNYTIFFMGDGNGDFRLENQYSGDNYPYAIAAGDFNEDGKEDVAVANRYSNNVTMINSFPPKWRVYPSSADFSASESSGEVQIVVKRDGHSPGITSVNYTTSNGSAIAGVDYTAVTGTLEFQSGETSKSITIPLTNDNVYKGNRSFNIAFSNPSEDAVIVKPATASVTILEDDLPLYPTGPIDGGSGVDVLVNGKVEHAGTAKTSTVNNQTVTTLTIDQKKLEDRLATEDQGAVVTIPANTQSDVLAVELNGQMIKHMEGKQAILEITTDRATYTLPARQINIDAIAKQLGQNVVLADIKLQIEIATPTADVMEIVQHAAEMGAFTLVIPPLAFTVKAIYGDTTVEISQFNAYVERTIAIPDGIDPSKITTGVVIDPDGTVRHVPTKVVSIDGKYHAVINSLTNSTYSVVWHPLEFSDVANHWAKNAVNNMGSRMVVNGTGHDSFGPGLDITRAEFAAIIIRALGLKLESGTSVFSDVQASAWYSSAIGTAYAYQLIDGVGDGTFRPNDKITREQAMVITARAMAITGLQDKLQAQSSAATLRQFADAAKVSSWAQSVIADCVQAGIIRGKSNAELAPQDYITRAEVAVIAERLLQKSDLIE